MRFLADDDVSALLTVVGIEAQAAKRVPADLPSGTIHPDLVAEVGSGLVHVEFVTDAGRDIDLRMVDYRLRLLRRDRRVHIDQYLLALRDLRLPNSYRDVAGSLRCSWSVVQLSRLDPSLLLMTPTTAALAALATGDPEQRRRALLAATDVINTSTRDDRRQALLGAATTLASIVLPPPIIESALEEAVMPVPVRDTPLARAWLDRGRQEGRQEGRQQAVVEMTVVLLEERFGPDGRIPALAERLARLGDRDRVRLIARAVDLDELEQA